MSKTKKNITEEDGLHKDWYAMARDPEQITNPDELVKFMDYVMNEFNHDYGTICHALSAIALAAARVADRHYEQGGITGFQAGFVMWGFIKEWMFSHNKLGLSLIDYDNLLYPQYDHSFTITLDPKLVEQMQKEAQRLIDTTNPNQVNENVLAHWKKLAEGEVPFGLQVKEDE